VNLDLATRKEVWEVLRAHVSRRRHRCAGARRGVSKSLGDRGIHKAVILAGLVRKAEEEEEKNGADDWRPTCEFECKDGVLVPSPEHGRVLGDTRESPVDFGPANDWAEGSKVAGHDVGGKRYGADGFEPGKTHEANIAEAIHVRIDRQVLLELRLALPNVIN